MNPMILHPIPPDDIGRISTMMRQLSVNPAPASLIEWLEKEGKRLDAAMRRERDDSQLKRLQGASLAIEDILTELERVSGVQRPWNAR